MTDTYMFISKTVWAAKEERPGQNNGLGQQHNDFIRRVNIIKAKAIERKISKPADSPEPSRKHNWLRRDDEVIPSGDLMLIKIEALTR
ncbi:hypothetical protein Baya_10104 [Bagarius yarrelli]|uniref:Uncharacterized protein n=1 Tax=Bagarius yarrelli TaxID=175774 RepID=A0A556UFG4_BAGYA|nr:hypothetical protein Baya_10104 [Bagarius yarrelli]